jgi:hypothetical protein
MGPKRNGIEPRIWQFVLLLRPACHLLVFHFTRLDDHDCSLQGGAIMPRMKVMGPKGQEWKTRWPEQKDRARSERDEDGDRVVNERKREIKSGPLIFVEEIFGTHLIWI